MNFATSQIKSQSVQQVEKAFVAKFQTQAVLFIKSHGNEPIAYQLPVGFLEKLKASSKPSSLFPLGRTVITQGVLEALQETGQSAGDFLSRHQ